MRKSKKNLKEIALVFFCGAGIRILLSFFLYPVNYISDETSAISVAAFLAGYDWSDVITNASYYGIGILWIFAPLFKLGISGIAIYKIISVFSGIVLGLCGVIAYKIVEIFFPDIMPGKRTIIACVCSCSAILNTYLLNERNEEMLLLISWVICFLLLKILTEDKPYHQIILGLVMIYSLTLHTRSLTYFGGAFLLAVLYGIQKKKQLFRYYFWVEIGLGYLITRYGLKFYRSLIWGDKVVKNADAGSVIEKGAKNFHFDIYQLKASLMIIFGQLFTGSQMTFGLMLVAGAVIIVTVIGSFKHKYTGKDLNLLYIGCFFFICMTATIFMQSFTWSAGVYNGLTSGTYDWVYHYKAFTYLRYPGPYIPPMILSTLLFLERNADAKKGISIFALAEMVFLTFFWEKYILPYANGHWIDIYMPMQIVLGLKHNGMKSWLLVTLTVLAFGIFSVLATYFEGKIKKCWFLLAILFMMADVTAMHFCVTYPKVKYQYEYVDAGSDILSRIKGDLVTKEVYVVDTSGATNHQTWYLYQYLNYDVHIIPVLEEVMPEECVILSNGILEDDIVTDFDKIQLDGDELLYYRGKQTGEVIKGILE